MVPSQVGHPFRLLKSWGDSCRAQEADKYADSSTSACGGVETKCASPAPGTQKTCASAETDRTTRSCVELAVVHSVFGLSEGYCDVLRLVLTEIHLTLRLGRGTAGTVKLCSRALTRAPTPWIAICRESRTWCENTVTRESVQVAPQCSTRSTNHATTVG